jgi:prepilin-type N-terminal cleavage/methylation domain-containing protein
MSALMTPDRRRRYSGFTLLEVLIVIAVVAVLAAISVSATRMLITRARVIESSTNLRSLVIANTGYLADFGVYCPADDQSNNRRWHGARSGGGKFDPAAGFLAPYLGKSMRVNRCPLFEALVRGSSSFEDGTGGYGYNAAYIGGQPGGGFDRVSRLRISARLAQVGNPVRTVMFATTAYARVGGLQEYPYCEPPFWDFGSGPSGNRPSPSVHFRAGGKALIAWCDGSVTAESKNATIVSGDNPHGGDAGDEHLGWCGPEENNGWWNPAN